MRTKGTAMVTRARSEMDEDEDDRDYGTGTAWRKVGTGGEQSIALCVLLVYLCRYGMSV